ncbi:MAG: glutathione S-transferase family protein [Sulfuricellaceae bacterium]|nr:glutathione S-transferase family protein [Sulfuricellaceae bacterium]
MEALTLVIGNKNYSSWSLRPWLFLKHNGVPFSEVPVALYQPHSALRQYSPSGLVPVLHHDDLWVWDSLAICEYVSERFLNGKGWPTNMAARAVARAVSAEMHSGFQNLRSNLPMNLKARYKWKPVSEATEKDIRRIVEIWEECRARYGNSGPWLFGTFSIADAMFAPVAWRFHIYGVPLGGIAQEYTQQLLELDGMLAWHADAVKESEALPQFEAQGWEPV